MADASSTPQQSPSNPAPHLPADKVFHVEMKVASGDMLDVRHFQVSERLSSLFEVQLRAVSDNPDIDFEAVIGQTMSFSANAQQQRAWSGICSDLRQVASEEQGLSTYELTLVPRLWLLTQRRNHRMFQHKSEIDIVLQILGEWKITPTLRLTGVYRKRKYRVQYGESDFTFISRMLEDAGVSFYFDNSGESVLVLDDGPQGNTLRKPIAFRDHPTDADIEHVTKVNVGRRLRPGKYTVRDHDYRRPASYPLVATAAGNGPIEDQLERFHYVPGAFLFESSRSESTPNADDKGKYRAEESEGEALAQRRLDAKRAITREIDFETNTIDLAPGTVVSFFDHPKSELGADKRLLILESRFSGEVPDLWRYTSTAVSADAQYRPALQTPKPTTRGVESATVVGPAGEEIHVDEFGRVRVHFHWDRESQMNDDSSCWIHVSQPWGGSGFGGTNLPRIGQEVIVDFLGGDPDRPIITGRVYTNLEKTPYKLPDNKTQSGWKSNSTQNTGGYNEIMFEDQAGRELLRMQAEKDLNKLVKNDEQRNIGNDRTTSIGHNEDKTIGNDLMKQVMNNAREMVGMNRSRAVGANENVDIGGSQKIQVAEKIEIICGKSKLEMDKNGVIKLTGSDITIAATGHVQVTGDPIDLN
ncbi:type VI secretion system Vgr family protein [Chondromyces apiculatus]|uniref:VgrG protein n=1 Tax=Chondromyces apiculatus DSM 436 TaxID=1192034 RepID=A0A017T996_9BACT|nr:type VI secretion system tip protein TssI/VgrG [Chondromyces apiculatus]EYF05390.1 VgrG protein [Chondromyces apiculatus DSM 436]